MSDYPARLRSMADFSPASDTITKIIPEGAAFLREVSRYVAELEAALLPFAESYPADCVNENGWTTTVHREAISTWFGPSDFRAARTALAKSKR